MGIPFEPITMLGSAIIGGIIKLWAMHLEGKRDAHQQMIAGLNANAKVVEDARRHNGHAFQWARRFIVVTSMLSIIALPLWAPLFLHDLVITHGWTEWKPGFWFLTEGKETLVWHEAKGLVITPMHTNLIAALSGFYLGVSSVGNRR